MPRAKAILQSDFPYTITARCINREWFHVSTSRVWEIFTEELNRTSKDNNLVVHSFILMSNHFHLIASTPDANISECMHRFMMRSSRRLTQEGNRINETFAGRHYKCILHHQSYFLNAYKYNYRNPVTAGICERVEDYPFSTLQGLLKNPDLPMPKFEDAIYASDPRGTLEWLNTAPHPKKLEAVRCGLKRQYFRSKNCRTDNSPIMGENDIL